MATKLKNAGFYKGDKSTGLAAIASPYATTYITMGRGGIVGAINPPSARTLGGDDYWTVRLSVKNTSAEANCEWMWTTFKKEFTTEEEARTWVRSNWKDFNARFELVEQDRY